MYHRFNPALSALLAFIVWMGWFSVVKAMEENAAARGPLMGLSEVGGIATPSVFPASKIPTEIKPKKSIPRRYEFDTNTVEFLKANPPLLPNRGPTQIEDSGPLPEQPEPLAPNQPGGFQGIMATGYLPPDNATAAGPAHVVEMVNQSWQAFTKTGAPAGGSHPFCGTGGWWSNRLPAGVIDCFDPHVLYDQFSNRWVMTAVAQNTNPQGSWYLIATSWSSDPTGNWCTWALDATLDGSAQTSNSADFPLLGLDNDAIYITSNQFSFSSGTFQYSKLRILGKAQFYDNTCNQVQWVDIANLRNPDGSKAFSVQPAQTFGIPGVQYLIDSRSVTPGSSVTLWSLTNPLGASPNLTKVNVPVASYSPPPGAEQCGGGTLIDTGDARLLNAVYRDGALWTAHNIACPADGTKVCAGLIRIDPAGPTVMDDFAFGAPSSGFHYFYPAIMTDTSDNMYLVFNRSSAQECVGIWYSGRPNTEPPNTLQSSVELKAGVASYSQDRWGDYSGIAADPVNAHSVWIAGEYVPATDTWGTWVGKVSFGAPTIDFDGDGKMDVAVYQTSTGNWFYVGSTSGFGQHLAFGGPGYIPVPGDYDGDGKTDTAVYDTTTGNWFISLSSGGFISHPSFGGPGFIPVPGDYDGDGKTDVAVYEVATGNWFIVGSSSGFMTHLHFGGPGYMPVPGDYDGDGKTDRAVYDTATGNWFMADTTAGFQIHPGFGGPGYIPVPGDYDGDGKTDIAVYQPNTGNWFYVGSTSGFGQHLAFGGPGYIPVPGDYDGDGVTDTAVYDTATGNWFMADTTAGFQSHPSFGGSGYVPVLPIVAILRALGLL